MRLLHETDNRPVADPDHLSAPSGGLFAPQGCFSQFPLQQQFSLKTEEITGKNQIGAEFIWGVAGRFVMQAAELQNNRFSF